MSEEDPKSWVYAGGLPFELSEGDIVCVFSQYGEILEISLARDKDTGKSRGFCFIKYEDTRSCELAVDNLNGAAIVGRKIRVSYPSNLNFVKSRRPATVAPTENSTLPQVVPDKRKRDEIDEDDRIKKSSRYDDADRPPRMLNPCYGEEPRKALQYNREERDRESPRHRDERKYKREDEGRYRREDERRYEREERERYERKDEKKREVERRDIKSSRLMSNDHGEDRKRRSSKDRYKDRYERSSRHKEEDRPKKSPKHSHRDKDKQSSSKHRDHDRHKKSSKHRDERRSKRSPSYSDEERSPRHRERHRAQGSSRHG